MKEVFRLSLRRKIMIAIITLVFIPVIAMGSISYWTFSDAMETKTSEYYGISLTEMDRKLNYAFAEINTLSDVGILRPNVQQLLKQKATNINLPEANELNKMFFSHLNVSSFALYSNTGLVHSTQGLFSASLNQMKEMSWYPDMIGNLGRYYWLGPYENPLMYDRHPLTLTHARAILDYYTLKPIGFIIITVKPDILEQVFWEAPQVKKRGDILLVNSEGTILYSKSGENMGTNVEFPFVVNPEKEQSYTDIYNDKKTLINYLPSQIDGWYFIAVTPIEDIRSESTALRNITLGLLF